MYALTFRLALVGLNFSLPSLPCSPTMSFTVILIRVSRMKLDHFRILMNSILTSTCPMLSSLNVCQLMALTCCWSSGKCQEEESSHHLSIIYNNKYFISMQHVAFCSGDHSTASGPNCIQTSTHSCGKYNHVLNFCSCDVRDCCITTLPVTLQTTARSSGWWDLWWTIFVPFTRFHVTSLQRTKFLATMVSTLEGSTVCMYICSSVLSEDSTVVVCNA